MFPCVIRVHIHCHNGKYLFYCMSNDCIFTFFTSWHYFLQQYNLFINSPRPIKTWGLHLYTIHFPYEWMFIVVVTWKSAVERMCLPSGLHLTAVNPASPSSILQVQSGFSSDHTYGNIQLSIPLILKELTVWAKYSTCRWWLGPLNENLDKEGSIER